MFCEIRFVVCHTETGLDWPKRCPEAYSRPYVQPRSWWTTPPNSPLSFFQGVEGFRVKPWIPPNVVFCECLSNNVRWGELNNNHLYGNWRKVVSVWYWQFNNVIGLLSVPRWGMSMSSFPENRTTPTPRTVALAASELKMFMDLIKMLLVAKRQTTVDDTYIGPKDGATHND